MRIIFMGTPDFSVPTLDALLKAGHEVVAVYSQPPRPAGRGKKDRLSPVHLFADQHGLEVRIPVSLRKLEARKAFEALDAEIAIVVAYGLILGPKVLAAPKHGCLNLHGSLLPRWRGAAPIQRAIMAGDKTSGIEVMRMEAGLDTGPVCMSARVDITPDMSAGELHDDLMVRGAALMVETLAKLQAGSLSCTEQPVEGIIYASKIEKSETRIDWHKSAAQIHNHIRGLSPFPGAWFEIEVKGKTERIKVLSSEPVRQVADQGIAGQLLDDQLLVACGEGALRLTKLQRAGKRTMTSADLLRGLPIAAGQNLK